MALLLGASGTDRAGPCWASSAPPRPRPAGPSADRGAPGARLEEGLGCGWGGGAWLLQDPWRDGGGACDRTLVPPSKQGEGSRAEPPCGPAWGS